MDKTDIRDFKEGDQQKKTEKKTNIIGAYSDMQVLQDIYFFNTFTENLYFDCMQQGSDLYFLNTFRTFKESITIEMENCYYKQINYI